MPFWKKNPPLTEADERAEVRDRADAMVLQKKALSLGREVQAHAALLKAKADELREVLERGNVV